MKDEKDLNSTKMEQRGKTQELGKKNPAGGVDVFVVFVVWTVLWCCVCHYYITVLLYVLLLYVLYGYYGLCILQDVHINCHMFTVTRIVCIVHCNLPRGGPSP